jgi:hypothetical protein
MEIEPESSQPLDTSEDLDLVTIFESGDTRGQMEAQLIRGVLESNGVPVVIVGDTTLPYLPFMVRVPKSRVEEAERLIAESREAGARGADEAEQSSEGT